MPIIARQTQSLSGLDPTDSDQDHRFISSSAQRTKIRFRDHHMHADGAVDELGDVDIARHAHELVGILARHALHVDQQSIAWRTAVFVAFTSAESVPIAM